MPATLCARKKEEEKRDKDENFEEEQRIERKITKQAGRKGENKQSGGYPPGWFLEAWQLASYSEGEGGLSEFKEEVTAPDVDTCGPLCS